MQRIGVLSDTHLSRPDDRFLEQVATCFAGVDLILHAGDLTGLALLDAFAGKEVLAVHGNMCQGEAIRCLPTRRRLEIAGRIIGLVHRPGPEPEAGLLSQFPDADCIVYGHTHSPACHWFGDTMLLNPGSFRATGRHGAPGTYAILTLDEKLSAAILEVAP